MTIDQLENLAIRAAYFNMPTSMNEHEREYRSQQAGKHFRKEYEERKDQRETAPPPRFDPSAYPTRIDSAPPQG